MRAESPNLTHEQLKQACRNIGYDLTCGACASLFYTGMNTYEHDSSCSTDGKSSPPPAKAPIEYCARCPFAKYVHWEEDGKLIAPGCSGFVQEIKLNAHQIEHLKNGDPSLYPGEELFAPPDSCRSCRAALLPENRRIADGCPCNAPRGVNHGLVAKLTCTCVECDPAETGSTRQASTS